MTDPASAVLSDPLAAASLFQILKEFGPLGVLVIAGAVLAGTARDAITAWASARRAAGAPPPAAPPAQPIQVTISQEAVQAAVEAASAGWREDMEGRMRASEAWIEEEMRKREIAAAREAGAAEERERAARNSGDFPVQREPTIPGRKPR